MVTGLLIADRGWRSLRDTDAAIDSAAQVDEPEKAQTRFQHITALLAILAIGGAGGIIGALISRLISL